MNADIVYIELRVFVIVSRAYKYGNMNILLEVPYSSQIQISDPF